MAKATNTTQNSKAGPGKFRSIDSAILSKIVKEFRPEQIGLSKAWDEYYLACQAADASHELLRAIHDIKESIEDAEGHA